MVPAHGSGPRLRHESTPDPALKLWVRAVLLGLAAGLVGLFVVASRIWPYDEFGRPMTHGTHRQLGLGECSVLGKFGRPCPTCGMTTSFALLIRGDVFGSLRANFAGTVMAAALLVMIPWTAWSAVRGRWWLVQAAEWWILVAVIATVGLALVRWVIVVGAPWLLGFR